MVGANSLVTAGRSFPDGHLILGSPARVVRELDAEEIARLAYSAAIYVNNSARYTTVQDARARRARYPRARDVART